ncbi:hypothetical protein ACOME3_002464 [Neoechinorhynchus agilis]
MRSEPQIQENLSANTPSVSEVDEKNTHESIEAVKQSQVSNTAEVKPPHDAEVNIIKTPQVIESSEVQLPLDPEVLEVEPSRVAESNSTMPPHVNDELRVKQESKNEMSAPLPPKIPDVPRVIAANMLESKISEKSVPKVKSMLVSDVYTVDESEVDEVATMRQFRASSSVSVKSSVIIDDDEKEVRMRERRRATEYTGIRRQPEQDSKRRIKFKGLTSKVRKQSNKHDVRADIKSEPTYEELDLESSRKRSQIPDLEPNTIAKNKSSLIRVSPKKELLFFR